mgnify:CR=1 FL=1
MGRLQIMMFEISGLLIISFVLISSRILSKSSVNTNNNSQNAYNFL